MPDFAFSCMLSLSKCRYFESLNVTVLALFDGCSNVANTVPVSLHIIYNQNVSLYSLNKELIYFYILSLFRFRCVMYIKG